MARPVILVVDDDPGVRDAFRLILEDHYEVLDAPDGPQALEVLRAAQVDLVLLDIRLPEMDGIEVLERIKAIDEGLEVILVTAVKTVRTAVAAMKLGAFDYLTKPFEEDELLALCNRALEKRSLEREVTFLRGELARTRDFEEIVGTHAAMQKLFRLTEQVARTTATVLITGESGTGKELIAHWIHELSSRRDKPMLEVNCAAIPRELLESELFGHEKGAFTDARQQKQGLLELANGGTLFLDEVGEMSLTIQVKLLRVLERMTFKRVGGTKDITVSVRVISATNQNLETMVREQRFREDLYYRLKVVPIRVPPLRERREDILPLAHHFLSQFNRQFGKTFTSLDSAAEQILLSYAWPGNIRELRNLFERIVLLSQGDRILPQHLAAAIAPTSPARADSPIGMLRGVIEQGRFPEEGFDLEAALEGVEREIIQQAFDRTRGNQSRTASLLQMKRDKLRYRMKLYDLSRPRDRQVA